jgi:4-aminobutyrate aminotransferase-like enzyme
VKDGETKEPHADGAAEAMEVARDRGVLVGKGGLYGNVLRLSPPLSVTEDDAARAVETLEAAFEQVQRGV